MGKNISSSDQLGKATSEEQKFATPPSISLPKGGGAVRGIGEKFAANPVTGTGSISIPIATSPGRSGFGPQLNLSYDSGSGNGPFGFGWSLSIPAITRKTDKVLPRYFDAEESDVFILSGAEDLTPTLVRAGTQWAREPIPPRTINNQTYDIKRYRPRVEGLFARIEHWTNQKNQADSFWRSISKNNITTWYGKTTESRIADPDDQSHIFSWLICQSYDDKGNAIVYEYKKEETRDIEPAQANERNRTDKSRSANRYLKSIKYGNRNSNLDIVSGEAKDPTLLTNWMFEVVFDYDEGYYSAQDDQFVIAQLNPPQNAKWSVRKDPYSTYRSGFEVRTYRLCRRILMFHHFEQELGIADCLVRSTEFNYSESPINSTITNVTQSGYVRQPDHAHLNRYLKKSLPPVEFEYSQAPSPDELARLPVRDIEAVSLENLPIGLDGSSYQWMDLDGEGASGILTEQANGWYYKRNLSANNLVRENGSQYIVAKFGATEVVASKPAIGLAGGAQFLDLAGNGQVDLVEMDGPVRGFYERTNDEGWELFQPFKFMPNLNSHDPNLKFVDLTGDGHADILITEGEVLIWHPSLAEDGFGPSVRVNLPLEEEKGPRLVFADGAQSIYLADLSGDGLSDLVRIRNGEVCYWPNLGYGRFGFKVTMDNAPRFDSPDQFDQRLIRLADIDGSGTTDILYLRRNGVQIYFNQSGNSWSEAFALPQFPLINNISSVQALDLLGNGTACLVWSSPLPGDSRRPMRYIALMKDKPYLMIGVKNNLGAETIIHYAPSTKFYLNDKRDGKPWITHLPFPVHVVERVETYDRISRNHFVTRYAYHHGYFDGGEREFRGFGMVEQWDTEEFASLNQSNAFPDALNSDQASHVPPVLTKTWFHTGAFIDGQRISRHFAGEYWREGDASATMTGLTDEQLSSLLLEDTLLPTTILQVDGALSSYSLTANEVREACRSLKGAILRTEVYALDGTEAADRPYVVSEHNYTIELVQPQDINQHAVFFTHAREQIDFHYERKLVEANGTQRADPRISHTMVLEVDAFGNILRSLAIGYRRRELPGVNTLDQKETHLTLTANRFANHADEKDWIRIGLPVESRTYEVVKPPEPIIADTRIIPFSFKSMADLAASLFPISRSEPESTKLWEYQKWNWRSNPANAPGETCLRLIEHIRTLYRKNNLTALSPLGDVESLALPGESYKLAFTPELLAQTYTGRVSNPILQDEGRYVHSIGDVNWWIPSGQMYYSHGSMDAPVQELAYARQHFFLPHRYRDPFHTNAVSTESFITYDDYNLLVVETRDALDNVVTVRTQDDDANVEIRNDYRVLQPYWVTDPNGNRVQVAFDALGLVVGTAVMGKPGEHKGDQLAGFKADLTQQEIDDFRFNPKGAGTGMLLGNATTRIIYDMTCYYREPDLQKKPPTFAATLAGETHAHDLQASQQTKIQVSISYSDGFGREIQRKIQAEPGRVPKRDPAGDILITNGQLELTLNEISPRWVGSGWTIFNNKGKPVRQYEPFFTDTHQFEFDVRIGVSPVLFYDPLERVVATLHPNHTWGKVVFDPWQQKTYDSSDTVRLMKGTTPFIDPKDDPDVGNFFMRLPDADYLPTWYAHREAAMLGPREQIAARKTVIHADTPTTVHFDTLGRTFLTIVHNKFKRSDTPSNADPVEEFYSTRVIYDIEGNQREVIDAKDRIVMRYDYDMLGGQIHQASMESGERWMLNDVAGQPIRAWDSRGHAFRTAYDRLHRPIDSFLRESAGSEELLIGRTVYGETWANPKDNNLLGKVVQVFDQAGVVTSDEYDFKGNLLHSQRQLAHEYRNTLDWSLMPAPPLEAKIYHNRSRYDALNRPVELTTPDESVYWPTFNDASLLERVDVNLLGEESVTPFVQDIDYNAKGQRTLIAYANGATTSYDYDPLSLRLIRLMTTRPAGLNGLGSQLFPNSMKVQDLTYTYDAIGNITYIEDAALKPIFHNQVEIKPVCTYTYDAISRLIEAQGREHIGQMAFDFNPPEGNRRDFPFAGLHSNANDPEAIRAYGESYDYDEVGNFKSMRHTANGGSWTRNYEYEEASLIEPGKKSNRLTRTKVGNGINFPETYTYIDALGNDVQGCVTSINSIKMDWDFKDQLHQVDLGGSNTAYYVYDASGQRVRKVIERQNGTKQKERIYIGGFEVYREYNGATGQLDLERETLHIMDDKQRIALVETRTDTPAPVQLIRYQLGNHLGSAALELDAQSQVISYEEYSPYGCTSYQAVRSLTETPKRYRYTGKERDKETGFTYHGARYYAPWLGRWTACDPLFNRNGNSLYVYVHDDPINRFDLDGRRDDSFYERHEFAIEATKQFFRQTLPGIAELEEVGILDKPADSLTAKRAQKLGGDVADLFNLAQGFVGGGKRGPGTRGGLELAPATGPAPARATTTLLVVARPPSYFAENKGTEETKKSPEGAKVPEPAPGTEQNSSSKPASPADEKLFTPAEPRSSQAPLQLGPGGKTAQTQEQVQRQRGTNKERGDAAKEHQAELSGGTGKEKATQTAKGPRLHDVRDEPTSTDTTFRREVKNYRKWITLPSGKVVQNEVRMSSDMLEQIHKDKLWLQEGKKLGENRIVQWDFVGAPPNAELSDILSRSGIPHTQQVTPR
jgi:RHS repeat-associated protein